MCGINGIIETQNIGDTIDDTIKTIERMNEVVEVRGPDGIGVFTTENSVLGHTRLAITDAVNIDANQPFVYDDLVISFNGEIYNHAELRSELKQKGYTFRTECDTEVVVAAFKEWGEESLTKFNGEFAFGIVNSKTGDAFLARDRTGVKPLYYSVDENAVLFSSKPRAIDIAHESFSPNIDAIHHLYATGAVFAAGETPLNDSAHKEISKLGPGECMHITRDENKNKLETTINKWYKLDVPEAKPAETPEKREAEIQDYAQKLRETVTDAIECRVSDEVQTGVMLSGGLDSAIVTAIAAKKYTAMGKKLVASTIRYAPPGINIRTDQDEARVNPDYFHAQKLVNKLQNQGMNVEHHAHTITPENFLTNLDALVEETGIHDSIRQLAMFGNYTILKNNGVKVALIGEGADEIFAGYWKGFPGLATEKLQREEGDNSPIDFAGMFASRKHYVAKLFNQNALSDVNPDKPKERFEETYNSFSADNVFRKMMGMYAVEFLAFLNNANDSCSMGNSIEARPPYQDHRVVELALQIPREYQTDDSREPGNLEKDVLKRAFTEELEGTGILERAKIPLPAASHMAYHDTIIDEYERRKEQINDSFWDYFNKDTFDAMGKSISARREELLNVYNGDMLKAGNDLVAWRDVSIKDFDVLGREESGKYVAGKDIRINDVFKLLTTMVWYEQQQNTKYAINGGDMRE
ncbi:MAG: asparagine synthase (glutamine-hydrolyzing) [Candidatus Woesearchaeota archaeon]